MRSELSFAHSYFLLLNSFTKLLTTDFYVDASACIWSKLVCMVKVNLIDPQMRTISLHMQLIQGWAGIIDIGPRQMRIFWDSTEFFHKCSRREKIISKTEFYAFASGSAKLTEGSKSNRHLSPDKRRPTVEQSSLILLSVKGSFAERKTRLEM